MTSRTTKQKARALAAQTGRSYTHALRQITGEPPTDELDQADLDAGITLNLGRWASGLGTEVWWRSAEHDAYAREMEVPHLTVYGPAGAKTAEYLIGLLNQLGDHSVFSVYSDLVQDRPRLQMDAVYLEQEGIRSIVNDPHENHRALMPRSWYSVAETDYTEVLGDGIAQADVIVMGPEIEASQLGISDLLEKGKVVIQVVTTPRELDYIAQGWVPDGAVTVGMHVTPGTGLPFRGQAFVARHDLAPLPIRFETRRHG